MKNHSLTIKTFSKEIFTTAIKRSLLLMIATIGFYHNSLQADPLTIEKTNFIHIGEPNNPGDSKAHGWGSVPYEFDIAQNDFTVNEYNGLLQAVATKSDTFGLWRPEMKSLIVRTGEQGNYHYKVASEEIGKQPMTNIPYKNALRCCNWYENGCPIADEGITTTEKGSYDMVGFNGSIPVLNPYATYHLLTNDEYHKTTYWKFGSSDNSPSNPYWLYPTETDRLSFLKTHNQKGHHLINYGTYYGQRKNHVEAVGSYPQSINSNSVYDMGYNVAQWTGPVSINGITDPTQVMARGADWDHWNHLGQGWNSRNFLKSSNYFQANLDVGLPQVGFRLVKVVPPPRPGVVANFTPGVNPANTPGIDPARVADFTPGVVADFTPGVNPANTPGIDPGRVADFTPGVVADFTPGAVADFTPGVVADFTPGVLIGKDPCIQYQIPGINVPEDEYMPYFITVEDGWIYYHDRGGILSKVRTDGADFQSLSCAINGSPSLYKNGIVFRGFDNSLYRVAQDGSDPKCLLGNHTVMSDPKVTEDGQEIYFIHSGENQLYCFDVPDLKLMRFNTHHTTGYLCLGYGQLSIIDQNQNMAYHILQNTGQEYATANATTHHMIMFAAGPQSTYYFVGDDNCLWRMDDNVDGRTTLPVSHAITKINTQNKFVSFSVKDSYLYTRLMTNHQIARVPNTASSEILIYKGHPTSCVPYVADDGYMYYQGEDNGAIYKQLADGTGEEILVHQ